MPRCIWCHILAAAVPVTCLQAQPAEHVDPENPAPDTTLDSSTELGLEPDLADRWSFHSVNIRWDNDGTYAKVLNESDKHYTNGIGVDLAWTPPTDWLLSDWWIPADSQWAGAKQAVGLKVAQQMYTASDILLVDPPDDDRPYAGYAYLGLYLQRATETTHDHLELDIGVVGEWSGAEWLQKWIHQTFPAQDTPQGWNTQLANEPTINLRVARTWRSPPSATAVQVQLLPSLGADLGNAMTQASADMTLRLGPELPDDFGPGRLLDRRDATGSWNPNSDWSWYVYSRLGARAVARNILLNGNTWKSSRSVDVRPFVGELEVGVHVRYKGIEIGYHVNWMTEEFETQTGGNAYGEWTVTIYF